MVLSNEQLERYSRNILLKEIGIKGQEKLLSSKVLVIGAGGLGSPAIMYLTEAGIGTIGIADKDVVELTNLNRQIIHTADKVGKNKTESAKDAITKLNPNINVKIHNGLITKDNVSSIISEYDFIIDATDNFDTKFLINDFCVLNKKPFSHAGVVGLQGQLMTYVPSSCCYRCVFKEPPLKDCVPTCSQAGILGAVAGVIGTLQAIEAIKYLLGIGKLLAGYLLTYDALTCEFRKIKLPEKDENCPVCNKI